MNVPPPIHEGKQGKHQIGHRNYDPTLRRSILRADPHELAKSAGTGESANGVPIGQPGCRERVDFGIEIGDHLERDSNSPQSPTTVGTIHYGKHAIHIVPARPAGPAGGKVGSDALPTGSGGGDAGAPGRA